MYNSLLGTGRLLKTTDIMKKYLYFLFVPVMLALAFVSCSSDDDDDSVIEGRLKRLTYKTTRSNGQPSYSDGYFEFVYDLNGKINAIKCNDKTLTFGPLKDGEREITWYNGHKLTLVDHKADARYAEVLQDGVSIARAEYDKDGYLTTITNGSEVLMYGYSEGNMSYFYNEPDRYEYKYSGEKNDADIDLNYFIRLDPTPDKAYYCANYIELGLGGKKSKNLIAEEKWPESLGFDYVYSYKKDSKGRLAEITRVAQDRNNPGEWVDKCVITVEYYEE